MTATDDPVELIPEPDALQQMLADSVRRSDLLRGLIRVARRKAAYGRQRFATPVATPDAGSAADAGKMVPRV